MTTTKKRLITILSFILAAAMLFGACKQMETDASKVTPPPTEQPNEVPSEVPSEAPSEVPSEMPTDAPTDEPTEAPTEAPTEEPFVSLQPGVLIEDPDNYTFEKDAAAGKVLVTLGKYTGGATPTLVDSVAYLFDGIKTPANITDDTQRPVLMLHRQVNEGGCEELDAFPISRPQDREYILNLIENADYSSNKPDVYAEALQLYVDGVGKPVRYTFYYEGYVKKWINYDDSPVFAKISNEDLLRVAALSSVYWRGTGDQAFYFTLFYDKYAETYNNYTLTLRYRGKETTLKGDEVFALRNEVFGVLNRDDYPPNYPVKTRQLCNSDPHYSIEDSIEIVECYEFANDGRTRENTCYLAPDGHIFAYREVSGISYPSAYYLFVYADFMTISFDTYSFDALLGYMN